MSDRTFETEFFSIADYLHKIATNQSTGTLPSKEILLRTYVNRAYYHMYHSARKKTLHKIQTTSVNGYVKDWKIKVDDILRQHRLLREFYETIGNDKNGLGLEEAENIAEILNIYNIYRVLADYYIETPNPELRRKGIKFSINFTSINSLSNTWKLLNPSYLKEKTTVLLDKISNVFNEIEDAGYSYDVAKILLELESKRNQS